jgi:hypothetical protein
MSSGGALNEFGQDRLRAMVNHCSPEVDDVIPAGSKIFLC